MDILDNAINRKLIAGNFPPEILTAVDEYKIGACNLDELSIEGLRVLRENPFLLRGLFWNFFNRVKELESLGKDELFEQEVNILINTGYTVDLLNSNGNVHPEASKLCPAITTTDKILWYGSWVYYFSNDIMPTSEHYSQYRDMMFAWIYLLKEVQKKELSYGLTINIKRIDSKTDILKLIEADWRKVDKSYFSKLTDYGKKRLQEIHDNQKRLVQKVDEENNSQKVIADETEKDWELFIDILNSLAQKETEVICKINKAGSPKDKLRIINEYNSIINSIERGKYQLGSQEFELLPLFENINSRIQKAGAYCVVKKCDGYVFRLHPAAFILEMNPKTFNYLFMVFHQFRLNPGKDTAKKFAELSLSVLKKNLGEEEIKHISIDDIIEDFYQTVIDFMEQNKEAIDRLSFDKLQADSAIVSLDILPDTDRFAKDLVDRITAAEKSKEYDEAIEKMITGKDQALSADKVTDFAKLEEERARVIEQETIASRIVASLNIIYMFCEMLRVILTNLHANIKIKNKETIDQYRRELMCIDDKLVHKVYSNLGDQEIGMLEYREKIGIATISLSEQEMETENYRNSVFSDVLKSSIISLIDNIEKADVEQILKTKTLIREEILRFPDCDEKERYTEWLDQVSQKLSDALMSNCKKEDDYQRIKENILLELGEKAATLPESTVDSLTTAEMLYAKYATEDFAEKGFDFSCISALYYQAFEEAYNVLIWKRYSNELNGLIIDRRKFTDILFDCKRKGIDVKTARGYLDSDPKQRGYYIDYQNRNNPETRVSSRCMYKSFAILIENIVPNTKLEKLCDYFAKITGFSSRTEMFNDSDFMRNCYSFTAAVKASADNRNNASHGGTFISVNQCRSDKKVILNDLESVRSDSIGLIQQLLYILNR